MIHDLIKPWNFIRVAAEFTKWHAKFVKICPIKL